MSEDVCMCACKCVCVSVCERERVRIEGVLKGVCGLQGVSLPATMDHHVVL